jgi:glutathione reductase (NADPH)
LVFGQDLCRDGGLVEDHRRQIGAHFVGHEGQELINVFGLAIKFGITAHQLKDNVYAYPTFSSDIKHMFGHA